MRVLNFGSLNVDYVYQVDHILVPGETEVSACRNLFAGGKGLNQSISLAKAGAPVYHAGLVGNDGDILLETLEENHVDHQFVKKLDAPGGHTVIQVDKNGQNSILLYGGTNRMLTREFVDEVLAHFEKGDYLVLQNEVNELAYIIDRAYEKGMSIVLNPSPYDEGLADCDLTKVTFFLINEIEGGQITGKKDPMDILKCMQEKFPGSRVVLTLGGDGSLFWDGSQVYRQGIYKVKAVDTTAAGDTFTGYFIEAMLENIAPAKALDMAARASAMAVTRAGAAGSIPTRAELEAWKPTV